MATISKLATSKYLTEKHWEQRSGSQIKYIIPHHMAGKMTGANCANYFVNNGIDNSANYCIGYAGDISCNVVEDYGAWTSSFSLADKYAITIEVSDIAKGDWRIPEAAQEALIQLMVDLIQRYPSLGGKAVYDPTDEAEVVAAKRAYRNINAKGNILLHNWTSAYGTTCPEWHMKQILPSICEEVNKRLGSSGGSSTSGGGTVAKRTLHEEAQYMLDNNINEPYRSAQARADGFDANTVQGEIDRMLSKDVTGNIKALISVMPNIAKGYKCDAVYALQAVLKDMGYYTGKVDGDFGDSTETALKAYQTNLKKHVYSGYVVNGICDQNIWTRLFLGKENV